MKCIDTTSSAYLALKEFTGLATFELNTLIRDYYEQHDELPTVDKCLTVDFDTSEHLIQTYGLKRRGDHYTTDQPIDQVEVNTTYRDLEVEVKEPYVGTTPIIKIKRRALLNRDLEVEEELPNFPTVNQPTSEIIPYAEVDGKFIYSYNGLYYTTDQRISDYSALSTAVSNSSYREAVNATINNINGITTDIISTLINNRDRLEFGQEIEIEYSQNLPNTIILYPEFTYNDFIIESSILSDVQVIDGITYINPRVLSKEKGLEKALLRAQGFTQTQIKTILNNLYEPIVCTVVNKGNGKFAIKQKRDTVDVQSVSMINPIQLQNTTIEPMLDRLESLYGIRFNRITSEEIRNSGLNRYIPDATMVNAFIFNGEIYINLDNASADAPIHELGHLLLGTLKQTNPEIYAQLVNSVEQYPGYQYELSKYPFRSRMDANEEIFVDLFAKHYTQNLNLNVDEAIMSEAEYQIARNIDSAIFPNTSTTKQPLNDLMGKSLSEIMSIFGTALNKDTIAKAFNKDLGSMSRVLGNLKEQLLRSNNLKEYCNG